MDSSLQAYYEQDAGFAQFVSRHGAVASSPEIRKAYRRWEYDLMLDRLEEERKAEKKLLEISESRAEGKAEGKAEGLAEGKAEGLAEGLMEVALNILKIKGTTTSQTMLNAEMLGIGIPDSIVKAAWEQWKDS